MKMTVGPLPAGVYWRRRAIVGGVVLVAAILLWTSCGGSDPGRPASLAASAGPEQTTADPATSYQVPTTGEAPTSSTPTSAAAPSAPAAGTSTVPPCADADLSLAASADQQVQFRGAYLKFTLRLKNVTTHDCARDVGPDFQELYLQVAAVKVWSSDFCNAPKGKEMQVLKPNIEVTFTNNWDGKANNTGCESKVVPPAGKYELVARLDTKISNPFQIQLT